MVEVDSDYPVAVLGANSMVGACLLEILRNTGRSITAFTRKAVVYSGDMVEWRCLPPPQAPVMPSAQSIPLWICLAPIWVLPDYFSWLETQGVRRIVVLSSTSRFTKNTSSDFAEQVIASRIADAEARVQAWAENRGVEWVILRSTLIYGLGRDKNITEIARFVRRFGFFPLLGRAGGLRQPVHAVDVADVCLAAMQKASATNRAYNVSGGEVLSYHDMVVRIFSALSRRPHLLIVPLWLFRMGLTALRCLPCYKKWSIGMAQRMNCDLIFDNSEAARDLDFKPRAFFLAPEDLPI